MIASPHIRPESERLARKRSGGKRISVPYTVKNASLNERILAAVKRWREHGDNDARGEVYRLTKYLNRRMATRYAGVFDVDEIEAAGVLGILDAIERFDPEQGTTFTTFAAWCILAAQQRGIKASRMIHVPNYHYEQRLRKTSPHALDAERARALRARGGEIGKRATTSIVLHDATRGVRTWREEQRRSRELAAAGQMRDAVSLLEAENARTATVLRMRFGLTDPPSSPMTLSDVSTVVGVSRERVRQIEEAGLRWLREHVAAKGMFA